MATIEQTGTEVTEPQDRTNGHTSPYGGSIDGPVAPPQNLEAEQSVLGADYSLTLLGQTLAEHALASLPHASVGCDRIATV